MDKHRSKYFETACLMNDALLILLEKKDFEYITVKDICDKAGVNRTTFYLHYQNTNDLLEEIIENTIKKLLDKYEDYKSFNLDKTSSKEDLYFFTPKYVIPYLTFLKENKKLYLLANKYHSLFKIKSMVSEMYNQLFSPLMEKFNIPEKNKKYILKFFMAGINAIIIAWLEQGCKESIEDMADLIYQYVKR